MPRVGGRPNKDRKMVSFYLSRTGIDAIKALAETRGETASDTLRTMLAYAQRHMPQDWRP